MERGWAPEGIDPILNLYTHLLEARLRDGRGGHTAVLTDDARWSYRAIDARAASYAVCFHAAGVQPGARVLIALPDGPDLVAAFFGALRLGAIAAVTSPDLPEGHLTRVVDDVAPAVVVTVVGRRTECAVSPRVPVPVLVPADVQAAAGAIPPVHRGSPGDDAVWQFSSGSTGGPKAVRHSHWGLAAAAEAYGVGVLGLGPADVTLAAPRLSFGYAMGANFLFPFAVGATIVLFEGRPTAAALVERIRRHGVTVLISTPASVRQMLTSGVSRETLSGVRVTVSAGEALPSALAAAWLEQCGPILDGLGMTEMGHIVVSNRLDDIRPGLLGQAVPGYELRARDRDGQDVPPGEPGELWVRGPSRALGYWQRPEDEARVFRDDWCVTGDAVRLTPDGYVEYCGRIDDLLKVNGQWVAPRAVEDCLLSHPAVREAAVVGVPDENGLVRPHALVVSDEISGTLTGELQALVRERLAPHAHPRSVTYIDALPRTAQGKVDRGALAALV